MPRDKSPTDFELFGLIFFVDSISSLAFLQEFFQGGKVHCYANFYCFRIKFRGATVSEGGNCLRGAPPVPLWKKASLHRRVIIAKIKIIYINFNPPRLRK